MGSNPILSARYYAILMAYRELPIQVYSGSGRSVATAIAT